MGHRVVNERAHGNPMDSFFEPSLVSEFRGLIDPLGNHGTDGGARLLAHKTLKFRFLSTWNFRG